MAKWTPERNARRDTAEALRDAEARLATAYEEDADLTDRPRTCDTGCGAIAYKVTDDDGLGAEWYCAAHDYTA